MENMNGLIGLAKYEFFKNEPIAIEMRLLSAGNKIALTNALERLVC